MSVADIRKNRYAILVCGILTMLMFGTIYAWSIFILSLIHISLPGWHHVLRHARGAVR